MLKALIFSYIFFTCLSLFISITPSHKLNVNNSLRIFFIKIIIIKVNIMRSIVLKLISSLRNVIILESISTKNIIIRNYSITKFFKHFICAKPVRNKLVEKHQQLYYTFLESCIYQGNILL